MKKKILSAMMAIAFMASTSVMAQEATKKETTKAKTETKECSKKDAKGHKKDCCKKSDSASEDSMGSESIEELRNKLRELTKDSEMVAKNIQTFDTLDFEVFSKQEWDRFHESHAENIKVHFPDGTIKIGLKIHIEDMKKMFIHSPDCHVTAHPVKFGSGKFTAVVGKFAGTFSKPMPIGNGKFIQPTFKKYEVDMCTIGIWNEQGTMDEEYLFWDQKTYMDQIM
jgi:hypothetical protein